MNMYIIKGELATGPMALRGEVFMVINESGKVLYHTGSNIYVAYKWVDNEVKRLKHISDKEEAMQPR